MRSLATVMHVRRHHLNRSKSHPHKCVTFVRWSCRKQLPAEPAHRAVLRPSTINTGRNRVCFVGAAQPRVGPAQGLSQLSKANTTVAAVAQWQAARCKRLRTLGVSPKRARPLQGMYSYRKRAWSNPVSAALAYSGENIFGRWSFPSDLQKQFRSI